MAQPELAAGEKKNMSLLIRGSIWIAIGALIAAALVCVVWVLIGDQDGLIGRAFLTILLLAAFAGIAIAEAGLAPRRPDWLALASMVSWIVALLVGAFKIWLPEDQQFFGAGERFFHLLLVIGILQLALLHVRLFTPAASRYVTGFTRTIYIVTIVFLSGLVAMLVFYLTFPHNFEFGELYWRIVVALTILVAVGTTLIPLLNALFAPKRPPVHAVIPPSWPLYADGVTPLPALPDATPDWNAYYTGYPTVPAPQPSFAQLAVPTAPPVQPVAPAPVAPAAETFSVQAAAPAPIAPSAPVPPPVASPSVPQASVPQVSVPQVSVPQVSEAVVPPPQPATTADGFPPAPPLPPQ